MVFNLEPETIIFSISALLTIVVVGYIVKEVITIIKSYK